jgi:uncharacterized membrane protein
VPLFSLKDGETSGKTRAILLGIVALSLILRLYHLDHQNLWLDEALTWWDAQLPLPWLVQEASTNIHPPGVYLLVKAWAAWFGASPIMLRLPFVLCGVLIVILTFQLVRRLLPTGVALLAALLLALSPHQIYYAQEVRMYSLATVLTLSGVLCYLRLWEKQFMSWPDRVGFVLLFTAALHTHYFTAGILLALNLHYFSHDQRPNPQSAIRNPQSMQTWVLLHAGIAVLCLPWLIMFVLNADPSGRQQWRSAIAWPEGLWKIVDLFFEMVAGYNVYLGDLPYAFKNYLKYPEASDARAFLLNRFLIYGVGGAVMVAMFVRGIRVLWRQSMTILVLFCTPLVIVVMLMVVLQRQMQLSRYLMVASPYYAVILAAGIMSLKRSSFKIGATLALVLAMALGLVKYYGASSRGDDYRPVAAAIEQEYQPGDVILTEPHYMDRCLIYYFRRRSLAYAVIDTEYVDSLEQYFAAHASLPRVWLSLDYRSSLFKLGPEQITTLAPTYTIDTDHVFQGPSTSTGARLLRLRSKRSRP